MTEFRLVAESVVDDAINVDFLAHSRILAPKRAFGHDRPRNDVRPTQGPRVQALRRSEGCGNTHWSVSFTAGSAAHRGKGPRPGGVVSPCPLKNRPSDLAGLSPAFGDSLWSGVANRIEKTTASGPYGQNRLVGRAHPPSKLYGGWRSPKRDPLLKVERPATVALWKCSVAYSCRTRIIARASRCGQRFRIDKRCTRLQDLSFAIVGYTSQTGDQRSRTPDKDKKLDQNKSWLNRHLTASKAVEIERRVRGRQQCAKEKQPGDAILDRHSGHRSRDQKEEIVAFAQRSRRGRPCQNHTAQRTHHLKRYTGLARRDYGDHSDR